MSAIGSKLDQSWRDPHYAMWQLLVHHDEERAKKFVTIDCVVCDRTPCKAPHDVLLLFPEEE